MRIFFYSFYDIAVFIITSKHNGNVTLPAALLQGAHFIFNCYRYIANATAPPSDLEVYIYLIINTLLEWLVNFDINMISERIKIQLF